MKIIIRIMLIIGLFLIVLPSVFAVNATASVYDLTNSSNTDDVFGFVSEVNKLTSGAFMTGALLVWFVILLVAMRERGTDDALLAAGFITSVTTVLFTALDFVPRWVAFLVIVPYAIYFSYRMVRG